MEAEGYWFKSGLFEVEPGEDEETNPRLYERQLAAWLRGNFSELGYDVEEVIPEDWGWCVMCQREPFWLWIGCGSVADYDTAKPDDPPPPKDAICWYCFATAEIPLLKRIIGRPNTGPAVIRLDSELKSLLESEPNIRLIERP